MLTYKIIEFVCINRIMHKYLTLRELTKTLSKTTAQNVIKIGMVIRQILISYNRKGTFQ